MRSIMKSLLLLFSLIVIAPQVWAASHSKKKVQEVNFDGSSVDGQARNPNGSFVVQKKGIDFVPLYKVRENFDESIKDSIEYLK